jgi:DNA-directed RNA polymerase specialized sigma24 family protein
MAITELHGISVRAFWAKAWKMAQGDSSIVQECFLELILEAIEEVRCNPKITEQTPGYLLQKAYFRAAHRRYAQEHTYICTTYDIQVISMEGVEIAEKAVAPIVDHDMILAVHDVISGIKDDQMREVAALFMEGYNKTEVADMLGICRSTVTYQVKKLRKVLNSLVAA